MLEYSREFIVLTTHLNFTSAAKQLNLSQPGLSRHITELERRIGFELVTRNPVTLTTAGRYYLENISPLIENYDHILSEGATIAKKVREKIVIWYPPLEGRASQIFNGAIAKAQTLRPSLEFEFTCDRKYSGAEAVANGLADIAIIYVEDDELPENLISEPLVPDSFCILMRKDNPLASQENFTTEDLMHYYLAFSTNKKFEEWNRGTIGIFRRGGLKPKFRMKDFDDLTGLFSSFQSDEFLVISSIMTFLAQINQNFVTPQPADINDFYSTVTLLRRKSEEDSEVEFFSALCKEFADDLKKNDPTLHQY